MRELNQHEVVAVVGRGPADTADRYWQDFVSEVLAFCDGIHAGAEDGRNGG